MLSASAAASSDGGDGCETTETDGRLLCALACSVRAAARRGRSASARVTSTARFAAAPRRQNQMPNTTMSNQVPRQCLTKLAQPARDQNCPLGPQRTRRLQHQLAEMPRIGHLLKGSRRLAYLVGRER